MLAVNCSNYVTLLNFKQPNLCLKQSIIYYLHLACVVTVSDSKRSHDTRKIPYFVFHGCRTVIRENSINIFGPRLWDSFPVEIKDAVNLSLLRRTLLEFFCSSYL